MIRPFSLLERGIHSGCGIGVLINAQHRCSDANSAGLLPSVLRASRSGVRNCLLSHRRRR